MRLAPRCILAILAIAAADGEGVAATRAEGEDVTAPGTQGFARALAPRDWSFPRDHGSHLGFETEWWYFTGSVRDEANDVHGYELTFFRVAMRPDSVASPSRWRARDLVIAHLAVTDVGRGEFHHDERVQRAAAGLAGAREGRLEVWSGPWRAVQEGERIRLQARSPRHEVALDLVLEPTKGPVLHGRGGLSKKSEDGRSASYYYSMPRLRTLGQLSVRGQVRSVEGTTWMDHEFFTGATPTEGLGWDWFSARFEDGRDLMLYVVRHPDGSSYRFGTLVDREGTSQVLDLRGATWTPLGAWTSDATGARYPIAWRIEIPSAGARLDVRGLLPDQEVVARRSVGFAYWEGLSRYEGSWEGQPVTGEGYVELTGYQDPTASRSPGASPSHD